jgi:hypothetical protein
MFKQYLVSAIDIFISAEKLADTEKERVEEERGGQTLSQADEWKISHDVLVKTATFEAFAKAIGIPEKDIGGLSAVNGLLQI